MKDVKNIINSEAKFTKTYDAKKLIWLMEFELIKRQFVILNDCKYKKNELLLNDRVDILRMELNDLSSHNLDYIGYESLVNFFVELNNKRNEVAYNNIMYELDSNGYLKIELIKYVLHSACIEMAAPEIDNSKLKNYTEPDDYELDESKTKAKIKNYTDPDDTLL